MNIDSILLSEYATSTPDGRFTIVNAFNRLSGPGPAWGLTEMYITLLIHGHRAEAGSTHRGEIRILNGEREQLRDPLPFEITFSPDDGELAEGMPLRNFFVGRIVGMAFPAPGPYAFEVYIDDIYHAATNLYVRHVPADRGD